MNPADVDPSHRNTPWPEILETARLLYTEEQLGYLKTIVGQGGFYVYTRYAPGPREFIAKQTENLLAYAWTLPLIPLTSPHLWACLFWEKNIRSLQVGTNQLEYTTIHGLSPEPSRMLTRLKSAYDGADCKLMNVESEARCLLARQKFLTKGVTV